MVLDIENVTTENARETTIQEVDIARRLIKTPGRSIDIYIAIKGDTKLLRYKPTNLIQTTPRWRFEVARLVLTIVGKDLDKQAIEGEFKASKDSLMNAVTHTNQEVFTARSTMSVNIGARIMARRANLEKIGRLEEGLDLS